MEVVSRPASLRRAGMTKRRKVTWALTGLPGRANTSTRRVLVEEEVVEVAIVEAEQVSDVVVVVVGEVAEVLSTTTSTVAKVVGLPGFMCRRPKWTLPMRCNKGFVRSNSPMLDGRGMSRGIGKETR